MSFSRLSGTAILLFFAVSVLGEKHTVTFENLCGFGTPRLIQGSKVLSTGEPYTSEGPLTSAIAYLQDGSCGDNGEGCTLVETTLLNPSSSPCCGTSTDISLIPPLEYSVAVDFTYYGGCDGFGATCTDECCDTAFLDSDNNQVQVKCQDDDVNLRITFCPDRPGGFHCDVPADFRRFKKSKSLASKGISY